MDEQTRIPAPEAEEQMSVSQLHQIRLDKLAALQTAGKDPFHLTKY